MSTQPQPTLEWETRSPRRSRLSRLLPVSGPAHDPEAAAHPRPPSPTHSPHAADDHAILPNKESVSSHQYSHVRTTAPGNPTLRERFDALLPPHRTYLGLRRRVFLLVLAGLLLLLILIVGLAAGLSARANAKQNLPLPDGGASTHDGELTFYDPGLGACGRTHGADDFIVAVGHELFDAAAGAGDANPNNNPLCGRMIRVSRGGEEVEVEVVDRCEGCKATDLDLSPAAFDRVGKEEEGRVNGSWRWV